MVNWVLDMDPADAIRAMSRNLASEARRDAAKQSLLDSDPLAQWANERLVYDSTLKPDGKPLHAQGVGNLKSDPQTHLLTNYRSWFEANESGEALTTKTFKRTLVEMLQAIGIPCHQDGWIWGHTESMAKAAWCRSSASVVVTMLLTIQG